MRKNKLKWQRHDTVYEVSRIDRKIIKWEIDDIWIEEIGGMPLAITRLNAIDMKTGFITCQITATVADSIINYHDSLKKAKAARAEMLARKD